MLVNSLTLSGLFFQIESDQEDFTLPVSVIAAYLKCGLEKTIRWHEVVGLKEEVESYLSELIKEIGLDAAKIRLYQYEADRALGEIVKLSENI